MMYIVLVPVALILLVMLGLAISVINLWVRALFAEAPVRIRDLVGMKLRRVPPTQVVLTYISAIKAGLEVSTGMLEAHYLAGGSMQNVVRAMIAADKANIDLKFQQAAAIDLAGRNIVDAVQTSVNPKVIDCPDPDKTAGGMLDAVAKDGIRLLVKARVTVRTNLGRLVGGATEQTIIARVGQGIVSAIGSMNSYKDVLENPDSISRKVLSSGLDAQTAFEIVSIDIADVSVAGIGQIANVGAKLETDRADADKIMRQAEAEGRRAMAIAQEQEMRARVQEMQAKVIEAQAEVPLAMAEAFRKGNLGVMDFYRMQNIMADTSMRESLAGGDDDTEGKK
ncbi:flotillin-like protein FloA [Pontiella sp.]|uniref:flotillin-like protein FloA n=2 Tax=Pontiella sp. TaxID=2837462 RepID=UPI003569EE28